LNRDLQCKNHALQVELYKIRGKLIDVEMEIDRIEDILIRYRNIELAEDNQAQLDVEAWEEDSAFGSSMV